MFNSNFSENLFPAKRQTSKSWDEKIKPLTVFWKFCRPHTVIGSIISIGTLYAIVCEKNETLYLPLLPIALIIGISCNIFIVGLNQIADKKIDEINKPYLPIAAGELTVSEAKKIMFTALLISLGLSLYISFYLFGIIVVAAIIGWAYSMPPFHLKRHHLFAAMAITFVRGVCLNLGGFVVFNYIVNHSFVIPENIKILTAFIICFSIVIAWFKDLPDMLGDAKYNIETFAILHSPKTVLLAGSLLVSVAYLFTIYWKFVDVFISKISSFENKALLFGHLILFVLFLTTIFSIKLNVQQSIKNFYKRFWWFFFAEYLLYLFAYLV